MIVKIQKSFDGKKMLIYNQDRSFLNELPLIEEVDVLLKGRLKLYVHAVIRGGELVVERETKNQNNYYW